MDPNERYRRDVTLQAALAIHLDLKDKVEKLDPSSMTPQEGLLALFDIQKTLVELLGELLDTR